MIAQAAMLAAALPILGALALDARNTLVRAPRWARRRQEVEYQREERDDAAYADELARARTMMRASYPATRGTFSHYSRKVKP